MPFPHPLTADELDTVRASGYRAATNLAYCPQTPVMVARVATGIVSGVFAAVEYDSVTVGDYLDLRPGMTVYIGTGPDIRFAYLTTRVRKDPTSDTLYIGESAVVVQENDYIIVVNDYRLFERLGHISGSTFLVDWDVAFQTDPPQIGNLRSAYIDPRGTGDGEFTFSPTGYALAHGATIASWEWDVADGTITVGVDTDQSITATFPQGERWVRVTVTDSNGVSNYRVMWVCVGLDNTLLNIENPPVTGSMADGWNLSLNTWDFQEAEKLRALPENTLMVIYTTEIFGDDSTAAIVTNIDFIGRTRAETGHTAGDELWSTLQTGSLECEGFASQLNRLSSPQWSQTHTTSPAAWGQVNRPTVPRFLAHLGTNASTLWTLCSPHFNISFTYVAATTNADATVTVADTSVLLPGMGVTGTGIPGGATILTITDKTTLELSANATATGSPTLTFSPEASDNTFISQSLITTETSAGAAMDRVASFINAGLDYAPSGEVEIRRHAFYLTGSAKSALATVADTDGNDFLEYTLSIDYPDKIGRAFTGAEIFSTSLNSTQYLTGSAPPVARGNGEAQATEDGQILTADSDLSSAITELNTRTAALYAVSQPVDKLEILFYDAWRGIIVPSRSRWWTFVIVATNNVMGRIYTTSQRWICESVAYNLVLETGEVGNTATFIREPVVGTAQVASAVAPAVVTQALPDLPAFSPYPGMDLSGSINLPYDGIPDPEDEQPIDSYSANQGDEEAAGNFPPPGCRNFNILMNDSTGITTPTLVNGEIYSVRAAGSGEIGNAGTVVSDDMTAGLGPNTHEFSATYPFGVFNGGTPDITGTVGGTWTPGVGRTGGGAIEGAATGGGGHFQQGALIDLLTDQTVIAASFWYKFNALCNNAGYVILFDASKALVAVETLFIDAAFGSWLQATWSGSHAGVRYVTFQTNTNLNVVGWVDDLSLTYAGGGSAVNADAFYYFYGDNPNVGFPYTGHGLTFDGAAPASIPPYNTNHIYNSTVTGTGSGMDIVFDDTDYSDNSASTIKVQMCGAGL